MSLKNLTISLIFASAVTTVGGERSTQGEPINGQNIADFTLADFRSKPCSLSDWRGAKIIVVAFLGTECPIVKLYATRLQKLADSYPAEQLAVIGIDSNQQDSLAEMEHFARTHAVRFPLLKDPGNRIADLFRAERTPEIFVLDTRRTVRYHGRIDDQYTYETQRSAKDADYLVTAIQGLLADKPVSTPETEVVGCHIGRVFTESRDDGVTYSNQISRILQRRCVECHREGEIAPFSLDTFVPREEVHERSVFDQRLVVLVSR